MRKTKWGLHGPMITVGLERGNCSRIGGRKSLELAPKDGD
jgi:hypothetical protein